MTHRDIQFESEDSFMSSNFAYFSFIPVSSFSFGNALREGVLRSWLVSILSSVSTISTTTTITNGFQFSSFTESLDKSLYSSHSSDY